MWQHCSCERTVCSCHSMKLWLNPNQSQALYMTRTVLDSWEASLPLTYSLQNLKYTKLPAAGAQPGALMAVGRRSAVQCLRCQ